MMKKIIVIVGVIFFAITGVWAQIYQGKSAEGTLIFSDQPLLGGEEVTLEKGNVTTFKPVEKKVPKPLSIENEGNKATAKEAGLPEGGEGAQTKEAEKEMSPPFTGYKKFTLTSPLNEQTYQNQRNISVKFAIDPGLQKGNKIQLKVDGVAFGDPVAGTVITVYNLNRGSHSLEGIVLDEKGKTVITSNSVVVYIHYATVHGGG